MNILRYTPDWAEKWNDLVGIAPTGTFLHNRAYMDYHADRFTDCSLVALDDKHRLIAALPANISGERVSSHAGLTYGGWITDRRRVTAPIMLGLWQSALNFYASIGAKSIEYKAVPTIYHRYPAQDDIYALFRCGASLDYVLISSAVKLSDPLEFDNGCLRNVKRAEKIGVTVAKTDDYASFWAILEQLLTDRYGAHPVHSLAEIEMLAGRFPQNIHLYGAFLEGRMIAGVVVYQTHTVAHAQYIAASDEAKRLRVLPLLFRKILDEFAHKVEYFDFGTSNEERGAYLNEGLIGQKSRMGARGIAYTSFRIDIQTLGAEKCVY